MKHKGFIVLAAVSGLLAVFSCRSGELDIQDPKEGLEEIILNVCDPVSVRVDTRGGEEPVSMEYGPFIVTTEEWPVEAPTRVTEVTTVAGSTVAWGAYNNTAGTLWNVTTATPAAVSGSSTASTVSTGHYTSATGGPSITYYMANVNNSTSSYSRTGMLSVTSSGATVSVSRTSPTVGVDLVAGTATTSSPSVNLNLSHAYARTGTVTLNAPAGVSVSSVSWRIASHGSDTGYAGTYDIDNGTWTSSGALSSRTLTASSDFYLIPGLYDVTVRYNARLLDGSTQYGIEKTGTVNLVRGKVNNISASIPDELSLALYVAWASQDGVGGVYQEVPAHGDIYVGGHGTLEARLYTLRNGALDTYTVVPNASVTWSIPYDSSYISIDPSTGVLTGLGVHGTPGTYNTSSCYVDASYTTTVGGESVTYNANTSSTRALVNVVADAVESYGNPTLQLVYDPNPIVAEGGTSTPTLTYSQVVTYASGRTETITGTVTSGITWSGSRTGFTLNSSTGVVTAEDNLNIPSYTYGTPEVTSFIYSGSPIAAGGGEATPSVTYRQSVRERRVASSSRSITVTARATVNGKQGTASCVVNQEGGSAIDNTTYETTGGALSYTGSATGFTVNFDSGVVTAVSNVGTVSTDYANPVVSLAYNPDSFGSAGGTAFPTLSYSQSVTTARPATSARSITVTVSVSRNGLTGTRTASVSQSGAAAQSETNIITSGGSVVWSMDTVTGFAQNSSNGNVTVSQNTATSSRSTQAWATVSMNQKSTDSPHVTISQSGISTVITYRLLLTPNPGTLNVDRYGTYQVYRQELVNGEYSGNQVQIPNTDVTWSVQNTGIATVVGTGANAGRATGVAPGTTTVTVTLKSTAQYYSDYTSEGRTATATLNVVTSGGIDPGWTDPGSEIVL